MIHSTSPSVGKTVKICFVLLDFEGEDGRTDDICEYSDHYSLEDQQV